jgi:hypothetical protein
MKVSRWNIGLGMMVESKVDIERVSVMEVLTSSHD